MNPKPNLYSAGNIFWVPPEARWTHLKAQARQPTIGQSVDDAMAGIERDNQALKDVLPKDYARPALDKQRLGQLIDLISNIKVGDEAARSKDVLGRVYEYFLSQFASAEGKKGGEFYTPRCVVKLLAQMLEPYQGRVYDPCCGSSGMFVQSVEFIRAHATGNGNGGKAPKGAKADISIWKAAEELGLPIEEGRVIYPDAQLEYTDAEGRTGARQRRGSVGALPLGVHRFQGRRRVRDARQRRAHNGQHTTRGPWAWRDPGTQGRSRRTLDPPRGRGAGAGRQAETRG